MIAANFLDLQNQKYVLYFFSSNFQFIKNNNFLITYWYKSQLHLSPNNHELLVTQVFLAVVSNELTKWEKHVKVMFLQPDDPIYTFKKMKKLVKSTFQEWNSKTRQIDYISEYNYICAQNLMAIANVVTLESKSP